MSEVEVDVVRSDSFVDRFNGVEILKVKEVASILRCNGSHVKRLIEAGKFEGVFDVRTTGTHHEYRIPKKSVLDFMNFREPVRKPEAQPESTPLEAPRSLKSKNRISLRGDLEKMKREAGQ